MKKNKVGHERPEGKILVIPAKIERGIFNMNEAGRVINKMGSLELNALALHLSPFIQDRIDRHKNLGNYTRIETFGTFAPIINYGIEQGISLYAMGDKEVSNQREAIDLYEKISSISREKGDMAYITTKNNANWIWNIETRH